MKHKLLIPIVAFIFWASAGNVIAATVFPDTLSKPWRIKESAFLEKYGDSEKTKKFIRGWFTTRHVFTALSAVTGISTAGLALSLVSSAGSNSSAAGFYELAIVLGVTLGVFITGVFLIPLLTHSRKKLYRILEKHKNGQEIPKKFKRQLTE